MNITGGMIFAVIFAPPGGGGGGGGPDDGTLGTNLCGGAPNGAQGAVRIIWGDARSFPSNAPDV